jgi:hypothetical protein
MKETWTGNTTTKRNMDVLLSVHVSFGRYIACPCFFWSFYCLSMFPLVVVLPVHVSFGRCIACKHGQAIQLPKETWTDNTTTKRNMDRQYNDPKKHGQAIQRPKETWTGNTTTKRVLSVHVSFRRCMVFLCFFW